MPPAAHPPHPYASPCFLPLRRRTLARYLAQGTPPSTALEQAGLMAATLCRAHAQPLAQVERLLHEACTMFAADPAAAATQLAGQGAAPPGSVDDWLGELAAHGVLLAPDDIAEAFISRSPGAYPGLALQEASLETLAEHRIHFPAADTGEDDADTVGVREDARAIEHNGLYTDDQARALRAIAANPDELIDLDGYAGTGKGHLVLALMDARPGRYTYVAPSRGQVEAFRARVPADTAARLLTQIQFANLMAQHAARTGLTGGFVASYRQSTLWPRDIAERIGLQGIGQRTPEQVLLTAFEAINRWCASSSPQLQAWHFERTVPWAMLDAAPYVAAAQHVWRCMFDARVQKGGCLSLGVGHIGKWLGLLGATPPLELGMILVDEAHDLSPAWKQLLAGHAPGVASLGDPHQRLAGNAARWASAKRLDMQQSVRQGSQVDGLVNQALALDPAGAEPGHDNAPFRGASDRATGVRRFQQWAAVPVQGIQLYGSLWRLLMDAAQLQARGARVHVHPATLRLLQAEAPAPIEAWRSVREGRSAQRWEAFVDACQRRGQGEVVDFFAGGFDAAALARLIAAWVPEAESQVVLCLAQHAKNLQYDSVAMAPCCFSAGQDTRRLHNPVRAAYLALTRARYQLWVPDDAMGQLERSAQQHAQAVDEQRAARRRASGNAPARR